MDQQDTCDPLLYSMLESLQHNDVMHQDRRDVLGGWSHAGGAVYGK